MPIERVLQWNMGFRGKPSTKVITSRLSVFSSLIAQYSPSIVALQEAAPLTDLQAALPSTYQIESGPGKLTTAFAAHGWTLTNRVDPLDRAFALMLDRQGTSLTVWNLHVPALWVSDEKKRDFLKEDFRRELDKIRALDPNRDEIIVGDFNLPPFDPAIMRRSGLNANRSLAWSRSQSSVGVGRALFNPSWRVFGELHPPHGTYYRSSVDLDGPWSIVDQALITPELGRRGHAHAQVIARVGTTSLCSGHAAGAPRKQVGSDHLPVCVDIDVA